MICLIGLVIDKLEIVQVSAESPHGFPSKNRVADRAVVSPGRTQEHFMEI